jgi:L-rhamnonate dehydratase
MDLWESLLLLAQGTGMRLFNQRVFEFLPEENEMNTVIDRVEWGELEGRRPRPAGCNARLGSHGDTILMPVVRLSTQDGLSGFGLGRMNPENANRLLGQPLDSLFSEHSGLLDPEWQPLETALWDLVGQLSGLPVYALAAKIVQRAFAEHLTVPCYDTSLYFDDLHLASTQEAAQWMAEEARAGYERGHRAFKLKVGRGARHMPLQEGTTRDIAIIRAVREAVGPASGLMLDANNGYNLNLAKEVLAETADCRIYWLEEPFHEDATLYRDLKDWMARNSLAVLIADGEGEASPSLVEMARRRLVDVIQYDILGFGLTRWLELGPHLAALGALAAPHHYGSLYGNYCSCHLGGALDNFSFAEWDEAASPGLDGSSYQIENGFVKVPALPGFGLRLVEEEFRRAVNAGGGDLHM